MRYLISNFNHASIQNVPVGYLKISIIHIRDNKQKLIIRRQELITRINIFVGVIKTTRIFVKSYYYIE